MCILPLQFSFVHYETVLIILLCRTYFAVASRMVRPGQLYRVAVNILKEKSQPITVRASIQRNGIEVSADYKQVKRGIPETLLMRVNTKARNKYLCFKCETFQGTTH